MHQGDRMNEHEFTACLAEAHPTDRLEHIAQETGCATEVVQTLYQDQYQLLQRDARVRSFLPLLALKRVRDLLRHGRAHLGDANTGGAGVMTGPHFGLI
jgi:hypothetical protein